jgi:hypothetical protein
MNAGWSVDLMANCDILFVMTKQVTYCFLDTNFFYHFKDFREVNWREFLDAEHVRLVVTSPTLADFDKHKNDRTSHRRRFTK